MEHRSDEPQRVDFNTPLEAYQAYIDSLPEWLHTPISARRIREWDNKPAGNTYQRPEPFNALIRSFDAEQRNVIASLLEEERRRGVFDFFNWLNDQLVAGDLKLVFHNTELPLEPYGENLYMNWAWRLSGEAWPAEGQDWQDGVNSDEEV